jgi:hypothetical protein
MRALVLALISGHYVHTASGHAREILKACDQLAVGLGATKDDNGKGKEKAVDGENNEDGLGNVPLRLWVGERLAGEWTDSCVTDAGTYDRCRTR